MCVQLVTGVTMQFLFWLSSPTPSSVGSNLLEISSFISLGARLIEIAAAAFFLRVPVSTGAKPLAKVVLTLSILVLLVRWLVPMVMIRFFDDFRVISISMNVVATAYGIAVLVFMSRIAGHHEKQNIVNRANMAILLKVLLTAITLVIIVLKIMQAFDLWSLLIGVCGLSVVAIEISVAYQLLTVIGCDTNDQSPETSGQPTKTES